MISNIFKLTKILLKDTIISSYIIDKKTNKINTKSIFVWLIIFLTLAITYVSFKIISILVSINKPTIFLNAIFLIMNTIMIFQVILSSINVYFFSKDLDVLLPLPIKTTQLLIAKFKTILVNLYFTEFVFGIFPLFIYGSLTGAGLIYYIYELIILLIFPLLTNLVISIIMMFVIKLSKFIKNKDIFQIILTLIFIFLICFIEFKMANNVIVGMDNIDNVNETEIEKVVSNFNEKLETINKPFIIINPSVEILSNSQNINAVKYLYQIIFIEAIFLILFILVGDKYYLKNILNTRTNLVNKKASKVNLKKQCKKLSIKQTYLKKEIKMLFRNPIFFIQCIFPIAIFMVIMLIVLLVALPDIREFLQSNLLENKDSFSIDLSVICLILGMIQIVFTLSNISITSISREGSNIIYMKFLPIDLYKQFKYKSSLQIYINSILIIFLLVMLKLIFPKFEFIYLLILFVISMLLNILNSNLMVLVDLYKPNLHWNTEYEAIKNNNNKLFQYTLTIIIILFLVYLHRELKNINLDLACAIIILIMSALILIINKIIKVNIKKLFNNLS